MVACHGTCVAIAIPPSSIEVEAVMLVPLVMVFVSHPRYPSVGADAPVLADAHLKTAVKGKCGIIDEIGLDRDWEAPGSYSDRIAFLIIIKEEIILDVLFPVIL